MTRTIHRQVFGGHVSLCPHCGTDEMPRYSCRVTSGFYTCDRCHKRIERQVLVRENSWHDPQRWRSPEALERVRQVFPQVKRLIIDGLLYPSWAPDRSYVLITYELDPAHKDKVSRLYLLKAVLQGDDIIVMAAGPEDMRRY